MPELQNTEIKVLRLTYWLLPQEVYKFLPPPPQPFYGTFSGTTWVSRCQKRTSGRYGARGD